MKAYKIRNKSTGRFSNVGSSFSKNGKVYNTLGYVASHLYHWVNKRYSNRTIPDEWEIVEFELVEKQSIPAAQYMNVKEFMKLKSLTIEKFLKLIKLKEFW